MIFTTPNVSQAIGTSNQVLVNGGTSAVSGAVTFTLPQNIDTAATVTFGTVKSSQTNEPIFYLYSTNGTATNRNWAVASSDQNFGDFVISQSNALGGDPIAAGTRRIYITQAGVTILGTGTTYTAYGRLGQLLEVNGPVGANYGGVSLTGWTASDNPILLDLNKSKSGAIGTHTIVGNGDFIAAIVARGSNGTGFDDAASIRFHIDAAPGAANDMPGRISFWTTPDGSATSSERLRIDNAGVVDIGSQTNTGVFKVFAADNSSPAQQIRINAIQANITASDVFINFDSTSGTEGSVAGTAVAGVIAYNTFTGSHWSQSDEDEKKEVILTSQTTGEEKDSYKTNIEPGTILCSIDEMCYWKEEGYSQTLPKYKISDKKEDKSVYGVHGGVDDDGDTIVLALGSGIVLVTDEGGEIEIGDMLCTSSIPGHAMKYTGTDLSVVGFKARQAHKSGQGKIACTIQAG